MKSIYIPAKKRRSLKVRVRINGTADRPRLSVFRSNRYVYAQLIDDEKRKVLASVSEKELNIDKGKKLTKSQKAGIVGQFIAKQAKKLAISKVIFDRDGYKYHGRVKALAQEARAGGLQF